MSEEEGLRRWMELEGIPFEASVADAFRSAGFQVFPGIHYRADNDEPDGAREIDVLAVRQELVSSHPISRCTVVYVIECKTAKYPWVALRGTGDSEKWGAVGRLPMNGVTEMHLLGALEWDQEPRLLDLPPESSYRVMASWTAKEDGRSVSPSRPRRDAAYDAVRQVLSAAEGVLREDPAHLPTVAIPVIAVSSNLYAATFQDGQTQLDPLQWERIAWRGSRDAKIRVLDVVSGDGILQYAQEAWVRAGELLPVLRGAMIERRQGEIERNSLSAGRVDHLLVTAEEFVNGLSGRLETARGWIRMKLRRRQS